MRVNRSALEDLKGTVERLKEASNKISGTLGKHADKLGNFKNLNEDEKKKIAAEVMADIQSAYGEANSCLRARKCMLVPFSKKTPAKWAGQGCCPGQTGHHLLPDAMFRDSAQATAANTPRGKVPTRACWGGYSENEAPTICVEGTNQHSGSHGIVHSLTDRKIKYSRYNRDGELPYHAARDLVLDEVSKMYGCKKECLQAQLDAYYCQKAHTTGPTCPDCQNTKVNANSGMGGTGPNDSDGEKSAED